MHGSSDMIQQLFIIQGSFFQGLHCTAYCSKVHGYCPWIISMDFMNNVHGFPGQSPWIISMGFIHCLPKQNPWTPLKKSMDKLEKKSMDILEKNPWTFSMDLLEIVRCFCSYTPAKHCPWIPWILSIDSMDSLQISKAFIQFRLP